MDAIGVANEFVELALKDNKELHLLGLLKLTYLAHGFYLAAHNKPLIDSRFDRVEAWRYGPVIPSVYHTFKHHRKNPIKEKAVIAEWGKDGLIAGYRTPEINDPKAKEIIRFVWNRYKNCTVSQLVSLLHRDNTPWSLCYIENMNMPIDDEYTKMFYAKLMMVLKEKNEWMTN